MTAERREYGRGGHGRDMPGPPPDYFGGPPPPEHYFPPPHAPYEEPNWGNMTEFLFQRSNVISLNLNFIIH